MVAMQILRELAPISSLLIGENGSGRKIELLMLDTISGPSVPASRAASAIPDRRQTFSTPCRAWPIVVRQHVREIRQVPSNQGFAEKDRDHAAAPEI